VLAQGVVAVALLAANAFFVAIELSVMTARPAKLEAAAARGDRRARLALRARRELSLELAGAQLGVTMASLGLGFVAEPLVERGIEALIGVFGDVPHDVSRTIGIIVALLLVAFLHMVLGEMVPKNVSIAGPEATLRWLVIPNRIYMGLFRPLVRLLNGAANLGMRILGVHPLETLDEVRTAEELADLVEASSEGGLIEPFEHDLLSGALGLDARPVREIMVPWPAVTTVASSASLADLEQLVNERGHSRVPVVAAADGRVLGFLHAKDLLDLPPAAGADRGLPLGRIRRLVLLPGEQSLSDTLVAMQQARVHMAVVVGHGGRPSGLVTLEDVIEQLVGDIRDESDEPGS
jgi:CBS domain containing-hemolysin-like protein